MTPNREKRIPDTRIHVVLYFISPSGNSLSPLDVAALKKISETVNIIPVIGKSDALTLEERLAFKKRVKEELKFNDIKIYPFVEEVQGDERISNVDLIDKQLALQYLVRFLFIME